MPNQTPEQIARDAIDAQLRASGWAVQNKEAIDFSQGEGQAVREYLTDTGPADYVLFVDAKPVGVIEAKKETLGHTITSVEDQTAEYAAAKLKWVQSDGIPLPFLYEATGVLTRFTDQRDPKPRSREAFFAAWDRNFVDPGVRGLVIELGDAESREIVGSISRVQAEGRDCVGYWIARAHWGKGVASRALELFLREEVRRPLHATTASTNATSQRILTKCGFRCVGQRMGEETERYVAREISEFILE
jgi:RimJ/RimL family protein N-acetyltransferase